MYIPNFGMCSFGDSHIPILKVRGLAASEFCSDCQFASTIGMRMRCGHIISGYWDVAGMWGTEGPLMDRAGRFTHR